MIKERYIKFWTLALLQVVLVGNLQTLPANATYGAALPFLYFFAVCGFFIPCALMTKRLAIQYPVTGGAYIWCEKAFGPKVGFFTANLLWISNLLWYPSIFALISANFAYLFKPELASNPYYIIGASLIFFWAITLLNCVGISISTLLSTICSVIGIILPMTLIIFCAFYWWFTQQPTSIEFDRASMIPDLQHFDQWSYLIAIVDSLFGLEIVAVHAGNVENPEKNFPRSLAISSVLLIILLLGAEISIATIVPKEELSVLTGLLDALQSFFASTPFKYLFIPFLLIVLIGNIGSTMAWMLGSTRSMFVASQHNHAIKYFQKTNSAEAPVGVLIAEGFIFTLACGAFLLFPKVNDTFWLLLVLASTISLIYYIILFSSSLKLLSFQFSAILGAMTCMLALFFGFIPPDTLSLDEKFLYRSILSGGLVLALTLPIVILLFSRFKKMDE